jgi:flagellar biosynthesis/type III secretory pathway protein FliH
MAKKAYEEEKIRAIADQIKKLVPSLEWNEFTTGEMPDAIKQVYEAGRKSGNTDGYLSGKIYGENEGKAKGRLEGYRDGYNRGHEYGYQQGFEKGFEEGSKNNAGIELPELTNPGTANDMLKDKQLIDGEGNIVTGTIETKTYMDLMSEYGSATVTVPPGYYAVTAEKTIIIEPFFYNGYNEGYKDGWGVGYYEGYDIGTNDGYDMGYDEGYDAGMAKVKTDEARTSSDVTHSVSKIAATITIPSGYYAEEVKKVLDVQDGDLDPIVDAAYDEGAEAGYNYGYDLGFATGELSGVNKVKTEEAKDNSNVEINFIVPNTSVVVTAPSGYYADGINKEVDADPIYDKGYDEGIEYIKTEEARDNRNIAYDVYSKEVEVNVEAGYYPQEAVVKVDVTSVYNEGYNEGYSDGYDDGLADGGGGGGDPLLEEMLIATDENYRDDGLTFYSVLKWLHIYNTSLSSAPVTITIMNNHPTVWIMAFIRVADGYGDVHNYDMTIAPDQGENSIEVDFAVSHFEVEGIRWFERGV